MPLVGDWVGRHFRTIETIDRDITFSYFGDDTYPVSTECFGLYQIPNLKHLILSFPINLDANLLFHIPRIIKPAANIAAGVLHIFWSCNDEQVISVILFTQILIKGGQFGVHLIIPFNTAFYEKQPFFASVLVVAKPILDCLL